MSESSKPIVVEQVLNASKEAVWEAITNPDQMIQWSFQDIPDFKPEVGFRTQFNVNTGERDFYHLWTITESIPGRKIVHDWRYRDIPGAGTVSFEISGSGNETVLRVTSLGMDSFPQDVPEFSRESCEGGWKYFIQGNLKQFLDPENQ